jgi:hypothetical protein
MSVDFSKLNKQTADSFAKQRQLLKKVFRGQQVNCEVCQKPLTLHHKENSALHLTCSKGSTDVLLEQEV